MENGVGPRPVCLEDDAWKPQIGLTGKEIAHERISIAAACQNPGETGGEAPVTTPGFHAPKLHLDGYLFSRNIDNDHLLKFLLAKGFRQERSEPQSPLKSA